MHGIVVGLPRVLNFQKVWKIGKIKSCTCKIISKHIVHYKKPVLWNGKALKHTLEIVYENCYTKNETWFLMFPGISYKSSKACVEKKTYLSLTIF